MKEIKDSGSRRTFESGAVRDDNNGEIKGRFDLLPMEVIWELAKHYDKGARKYGDHNWQKGIPVDSYMDSALRHICKHKIGWEDEDHLIAAIWNLVSWYWEENFSPRAEKTRAMLLEPSEAFEKALENAFPKPVTSGDAELICERCQAKMDKGYAVQEHGKIKKICAKCYAQLGKV